jgi:hypothetical protein
MKATHGLSRHLGPIIIGVGIFHIVLFIFLGWEGVRAIVADGFVNAIGTDFGRGMIWYGGVMLGWLILMFGLLATAWTKATAQPLPRSSGWLFLTLGVVGMIAQPLSGAFFFVFFALVILLTRDRTTPSA